MIGVYKITCTANGKSYIGLSNNIELRWEQHKKDLEQGMKQRYFQNDYEAYGLEGFTFEVLEEADIMQLAKLEEHYINLYDTMNPEKGYNLRVGPSIRKGMYKRIKPKQEKVVSVFEKPQIIESFLTPNDVVEMYSIVDKKELKKLIKKGMPYHQIVGLRRFRKSELDEWFNTGQGGQQGA